MRDSPPPTSISTCSMATASMSATSRRSAPTIAARDLVLMLDVYKKDYEPMWAPLPRLAKAMATLSRKTGEPRGYAVVKRRK